MEKIFIVHNPRCSKSREALNILESRGLHPETIDYLNGELTKERLLTLLEALKMRPQDVLRTKEEEFQALRLNLDNTDEVIEAILKHPKILERPIIMKGKRAVIGRPPENVLTLID